MTVEKGKRGRRCMQNSFNLLVEINKKLIYRFHATLARNYDEKGVANLVVVVVVTIISEFQSSISRPPLPPKLLLMPLFDNKNVNKKFSWHSWKEKFIMDFVERKEGKGENCLLFSSGK